jgi:hypothetical protein
MAKFVEISPNVWINPGQVVRVGHSPDGKDGTVLKLSDGGGIVVPDAIELVLRKLSDN